MKPITTTKELQHIEKDILSKIHAFCMTHGLRYTLCGGTLLGAVRHKGFIPWDDDIDIAMPRPDYTRFCREFRSPHCSVHCFENDRVYCYPYAKVYDDRTVLVEDSYRHMRMGVYVDVMPMDGYPDRGGTLARLRRMIKVAWGCLVLQNCSPFNKKRPFLRQMVLFLLLPFQLIPVRARRWPSRLFLPILQREASRYSFENQPFAGCAVWGGKMREVLPAEVYSGFIDMVFEGEPRRVMVGWERYLVSCYGDYMTPPSPEKRVAHHAFRAWWKDGFESCSGEEASATP